ncbi:hypothetical protein EDC01DRAFT_749891 [Geopyxis carbonaria]|nr:hypothetical protein EDC01DRAFT_749891 [Geopyxis carbonaria]
MFLRLLLATQALLISTLLLLLFTAAPTLARPPGLMGMPTFKHPDLYGSPNAAAAVFGHMKRQSDVLDEKTRYETELGGREKVARMLKCQEECMDSYGISSPLWQECAACCRRSGIAVAYC